MNYRIESVVRDITTLNIDPILTKAMVDRIHALTRRGPVTIVDVQYDDELLRRAERLRNKSRNQLIQEFVMKLLKHSYELYSFVCWTLSSWTEITKRNTRFGSYV